jgi:hypothetical protein
MAQVETKMQHTTSLTGHSKTRNWTAIPTICATITAGTVRIQTARRGRTANKNR